MCDGTKVSHVTGLFKRDGEEHLTSTLFNSWNNCVSHYLEMSYCPSRLLGSDIIFNIFQHIRVNTLAEKSICNVFKPIFVINHPSLILNLLQNTNICQIGYGNGQLI